LCPSLASESASSSPATNSLVLGLNRANNQKAPST
jgi:hypothetical protein